MFHLLPLLEVQGLWLCRSVGACVCRQMRVRSGVSGLVLPQPLNVVAELEGGAQVCVCQVYVRLKGGAQECWRGPGVCVGCVSGLEGGAQVCGWGPDVCSQVCVRACPPAASRCGGRA